MTIFCEIGLSVFLKFHILDLDLSYHLGVPFVDVIRLIFGTQERQAYASFSCFSMEMIDYIIARIYKQALAVAVATVKHCMVLLNCVNWSELCSSGEFDINFIN